MAQIILFNKPFQVLSQFSDSNVDSNPRRETLKDYIDQKGFYPAGRLDFDSEGLMVLCADGALQARIADPKHKLRKSYWVQVEGEISDEAIEALQKGMQLKDGMTQPAQAKRISEPAIWPRTPPIRKRDNQPTSWIELTISEGRNRQVRRMTAHTGFPTLRLIRVQIGSWKIDNLEPGKYRMETVHLPAGKPAPRGKSAKPKQRKRSL